MSEQHPQDDLNQRHDWLKSYVPMKLPAYLRESQEDVVQDVLMKLMKADERTGEMVKNYGYMKQTVMSVVIDYIRKHKTQQSQVSNYHEEVAVHQQQESYTSPELEAHQKSLLELVYQAIGQLSEVRQTTLMLYLRGMKIKDIASLSDMKVANVRNEVYRGKSEVIKILNAQGIKYEV
jgi:RNA polymerase sigma-70 factor (ECF subfamily)